MLTRSSNKVSLEHWNWGLYKVRGLFYMSIYALNKRNSLPDISWPSLQAQPCCLDPSGAPTHLPCPTLSAHTEPISARDTAGYDIMKLKISRCIYVTLVCKGLSKNLRGAFHGVTVVIIALLYSNQYSCSIEIKPDDQYGTAGPWKWK